MSSPALEEFLTRLYTDELALAAFLCAPDETARAAGLDEAAVSALAHADRVGLVMVAASFRAKREQRKKCHRRRRGPTAWFKPSTFLRRKVEDAGGDIEERQEHLRLLGSGDRVAAFEDKAGHGADAEAACPALLGEDLVYAGLTGEITLGTSSIDAGARRNGGQCRGVADVEAFEEIALKQALDHLVRVTLRGSEVD